MNVIKFVQIPFCIRSQWQNEVGDIHAAFNMIQVFGALPNYTESVVLKGPFVLETAQWSMAGAISDSSYAHLPIPHFSILYLSLCLKEVNGKQRQLDPNVTT